MTGHRWTLLDGVRAVVPALGIAGVATFYGPSWTSLGILAVYAVGEAIVLALSERTIRLARSAASEAQASEHTLRLAADRTFGHHCVVRPERTLTGDLVLHVLPAGTTVDLQPGVQLWHVYSGPDDLTKVGRS